MNFGHWKLSPNDPQDIPIESIGFVYLITNNLTNKKYVGKKLLQNKKKRKPLKGRVNARRYMVESDWKNYCGSSKELLEDIKKYGKENFSFEIIHWCKDKWMMAYLELKEQIIREVLFRKDYYNAYIGCRLKKINKI